MRLLKRMAVLGLVVLALGGCTKSSITDEAPVIDSGEMDPAKAMALEDDDETIPRELNKLIEDDVEPQPLYDWDQVTSETNDLFYDKGTYPLASSFSYKADEEAFTVDLTWTLDAAATEEDAVEYARDMVMKFNDIVAIQTEDMEPSSDQTFGGLWNDFALTVTILKADDGSVLLSKSYGAGEKIDLPLPVYGDDGPEDVVEEDVPKKT